MKLTYSGHTNSHINVVLEDGETLGDRTGPDAFLCHVDGTSAVCRDIWRQGLEIIDPAASDDVAAVMAAKAEKAAAPAAAPKTTPEDVEKDQARDQMVTAMYPGGPGEYHIEPPAAEATPPPTKSKAKASSSSSGSSSSTVAKSNPSPSKSGGR